ncbi:signal transducing kinase of the PAK [Fusarium oxysporum]|nr:signal transducing kinase of the PAK [Fusarium oxysporum]
MDGPGYTSASSASAHTATSHRRKLIKKPPTYAYARSSSGFDGGAFDAQSLESKRSSQSLRRAPSAPPSPVKPCDRVRLARL